MSTNNPKLPIITRYRKYSLFLRRRGQVNSVVTWKLVGKGRLHICSLLMNKGGIGQMTNLEARAYVTIALLRLGYTLKEADKVDSCLHGLFDMLTEDEAKELASRLESEARENGGRLKKDS